LAQGSEKSRKRRLLVVEKECLEDLRWWVDTNRKTALRIFDLIQAILRDPFDGIGKPEPLRHLGPNLWSRRITSEDRLVYLVTDERIHLLQARYHY
jgi:toxin YoeB